MKKLILAVGVAAFALTSCTSVQKTATAVDVANALNSYNEVDLDVQGSRITYTFRTTKVERRGGRANCVNTAVREALKANGNADVLVAPEYDLRFRKGLFSGKKLQEVTVYGYPAKYKNFRKASN